MSSVVSTGSFKQDVSTAPTTDTWDLGTFGADHTLLVWVHYEQTVSITSVSAISYNSVAMTSVSSVSPGNANVFREKTELYRLDSPANGSNTFSVELGATGQDIIVMYALVSDAGSLGTPVTAAPDNTTNVSTSFTKTDANSVILTSGVKNAFDSGTWTPQTNNTEHEDLQSGSGGGGCTAFLTSITGATGAYTAGATSAANSGGSPFSSTLIAIEVLPVGGGATSGKLAKSVLINSALTHSNLVA